MTGDLRAACTSLESAVRAIERQQNIPPHLAEYRNWAFPETHLSCARFYLALVRDDLADSNGDTRP